MCKIQLLLALVLLSNFGHTAPSSCTMNSTWSQNGWIVGSSIIADMSQSYLPQDFAIDSQNNLYFAVLGQNPIMMYSNNFTMGQAPTKILSDGGYRHLSIDRYDTIYLANDSAVKILNRTTGNVTFFTQSYYNSTSRNDQNFIFIIDLYVDANLRIYVLDNTNGVVVQFLPGQFKNSTILADRNRGLSNPQVMFIDEIDNNTLYVSNTAGTIMKFTNDGSNGTIVFDSRATSDINALSFNSFIIDSPNQQLYTMHFYSSRIVRWSLSNYKNQTGETVIKLPSPSFALQMQLNKDKNLYAAIMNNNNSTTQILKFINCNSNITTPTDIQMVSTVGYKSTAAINVVFWNTIGPSLFLSITTVLYHLYLTI